MAFHKGEKYSEKHPQKTVVDPEIKSHIYQRSYDGKMSCDVAFDIDAGQKIYTHQVGIAIDLLDINITMC